MHSFNNNKLKFSNEVETLDNILDYKSNIYNNPSRFQTYRLKKIENYNNTIMSLKRRVDELSDVGDYNYKVDKSIYEINRTPLLNSAIDKFAELKSTSETPKSDFVPIQRSKLRDTQRDYLALEDRKKQLNLQKISLERDLRSPTSLSSTDDHISYHEKIIKVLLIKKSLDYASVGLGFDEEDELKDVLFPPVQDPASAPVQAAIQAPIQALPSAGILGFFSTLK